MVENALDKFNEGVFDVVISDRAMPEMNDDQLSAAIKKNAPEMPFIMLTGFGEMMETSEERPAGVDLVIGEAGHATCPARRSGHGHIRTVMQGLLRDGCG